MKATPWMLGCLLVGLFGQRAAGADSDTLTALDNMGFLKQPSLSEDEEAKGKVTLSIDYPGATIPLGKNENGVDKNSDTLEIPAFKITLTSDKNPAVVPELARERVMLAIKVVADSDTSPTSSDILTVTDTEGFSNQDTLTESEEADGTRTLRIRLPQRTFALGQNENGTGLNSDTFTIPAFTIKLTSDYPELGVLDTPETRTWTFAVGASSDSDVPEPTTMTLLGLGAAGLLFRRRLQNASRRIV
jgi:hypothetical protein